MVRSIATSGKMRLQMDGKLNSIYQIENLPPESFSHTAKRIGA